jgi:hypothetical protein
MFFVTNGKQAWQGYYNDLTRSYDGLGEIKGKLKQIPTKQQFSLAGALWPSREDLSFHQPGTKVELVANGDHPGLVGLRSETENRPNSDFGRRELVIWLDPKRDDLTTKSTQVTYDASNKVVSMRGMTEYLDFSQLPAGQWYPTRWRSTTEIKFPGRQNAHRVREYRLRLYTSRAVDGNWFTNPAKRAGGTQPGK